MTTTIMTLIYIVIFVVILLVHCTAVPIKHANFTFGVDLCTRPSTDPCSPGGKWDPLLNKLVDKSVLTNQQVVTSCTLCANYLEF